MEDYIAAILKDLYLPQAVKQEVQSQLQTRLTQAVQSDEPLAHAMQRLGSPSEVAERYNRNYRKALQQRFRLIYLGIAVLVAAIGAAGWIGSRQLYQYAKGQIMWYQAQIFQSQMNPAIGQAPGSSKSAPFSGGGSPNAPQSKSPFSLGTPDTAAPSLVLNTPLLVICTAFSVGCLIGINSLIVLKSRWMSYTLYLPPSMDE